MGSGASGLNEAIKASSVGEIQEAIKGLSEDQRSKLAAAGVTGSAPAAAAAPAAEAAAPSASGGKNAAFVFIKPHANTEKVRDLAKKGLEAKGIKILAEGSIEGKVIDEKKLIDQHYYAIAAKATIKKPSELNVPNDKFKEQFGKDWSEVLESGQVFNALDGCEKFGIDAGAMADAWNKAKDEKKLVKLGGGFYCGLLTANDKELYIMNGFFMAMRSKFTNADAAIYYYNVEWETSDCSWADFRGKVLGPTDPAQAPEDSLRGQIYKNWEDLGLKAQPNTGDNGMHASASPFEGLAERNNWLQVAIGDDSFGKALLDGGMKEEMIKDWSVDPQVNVEADKKGSIFDALEDKDFADCRDKLIELSKLN